MNNLMNGPEFCAGCINKGSFCDPLTATIPLTGRVIPCDDFKYNGKATLRFSFTDRDDMASNAIAVDVSKLQGVVMTQEGRRRADYYLAPGAGQLAINAVANLREQFASRVDRCSGPGVKVQNQGYYSDGPIPTCPAINTEVVQFLLDSRIQSSAKNS